MGDLKLNRVDGPRARGPELEQQIKDLEAQVQEWRAVTMCESPVEYQEATYRDLEGNNKPRSPTAAMSRLVESVMRTRNSSLVMDAGHVSKCLVWLTQRAMRGALARESRQGDAH